MVVCVEEKKRNIGAILTEVLRVLVLMVLVWTLSNLTGMMVFSGDGSRYDVGSDGVDSDDGNSDDVELPWNHVDHPWGEASLLYKLGNCQTTEMLSTRSLILLDHDSLTIHSIENIITPSSQIIFAIFLTSVASAQPAS